MRALLAREYLGVGIPRAVATFRHAMSDVIEDKLPFIDRPTLVCRGTRDPIITPGWADEVTRLLPEGRLVSLPGATHAVNHEMPLQTARVIDAFRTRTAA